MVRGTELWWKDRVAEAIIKTYEPEWFKPRVLPTMVLSDYLLATSLGIFIGSAIDKLFLG